MWQTIESIKGPSMLTHFTRQPEGKTRMHIQSIPIATNRECPEGLPLSCPPGGGGVLLSYGWGRFLNLAEITEGSRWERLSKGLPVSRRGWAGTWLHWPPG